MALLATWVGAEILDFGFLWRVPDACYTLPLFALPSLLWAYRKRSPATVGLYVPLVAWWVILQPIAWHSDVNVVYFIGAAGALFLAIAECHRTASRMAEPYRVYGVLLTAGVLSVLSFGDFIRELLRQAPPGIGSSVLAGSLIAAVGIGAIALADGLLFKAEADPSGSKGSPFLRIVGRQWLAAVLILLMAGLCVWVGVFNTPVPANQIDRGQLDNWTAAVLVPTVATNMALIVFAIWLMRTGLREDRGRLFAAGVLVFLLWAVFRYVDLFAGVGGMLGASLMFFLCGAALFGMARFWSHRKEVGHA